MDEPPLILFIKGIYKKDLLTVDIDSVEAEEKYNIIPTHYTGITTWIKSTNVLCSHCSLSHNWIPIPCPDYFIPSGSSNVTISLLKALFCSFPCAMTYIYEHYSGEEYEQKISGLYFIYFEFTNTKTSYIPLAPFRDEITCFGGSNATYSVKVFKQHIMSLVPFSDYIM
jgi:hypothetical protein